MSLEGERLLLQIDAILARTKNAGVEGVPEVSFHNLLEGNINRKKVMGIISILVKANNVVEPKLKELLNSKELRDKILNIKNNDRSITEDIESSFADIIKGKTPKVKKHNKETKKKPPLRDNKGKFYSLVSLKTLLNKRLPEVIRENMGKGSARKVLNYRTGRFANTSVVVRLANNREGEITVFYTYMKYPYQTFEPGFKQGAPASRDPRLLISKSIREIARTIVSDRMKAISV